MPRTLVLIPARNEADSLPAVIGMLRAEQPDVGILIVDDASTDATTDLLPALGVEWLTLAERLGVGGAIRAGLRFAALADYETVVRVDGDGQHPATEIDALVAPIRMGTADAVVGSRFRGSARFPISWTRRAAQRAVAAWVSAVTGRPITDATSGFWAFGPRAIRLLARHHPTGYGEPELLMLVCRNGLRLAEVPIEMRGRLAGRTSLTIGRTWTAGAKTALALLIAPLRAPERGAPIE
jgi:hypothetical protein